MTNSTTSPESVARDVSDRIERARIAAGRTVLWLSEHAGIAYKTLRRRLYGSPEAFTLAELSAIARVLDVTIEWLVGGDRVRIAA